MISAAGAYGLLLAGLEQVGDGLHAGAHAVVHGIVAVAAGMSVTCLAWLLSTRLRTVRF